MPTGHGGRSLNPGLKISRLRRVVFDKYFKFKISKQLQTATVNRAEHKTLDMNIPQGKANESIRLEELSSIRESNDTECKR